MGSLESSFTSDSSPAEVGDVVLLLLNDLKLRVGGGSVGGGMLQIELL